MPDSWILACLWNHGTVLICLPAIRNYHASSGTGTTLAPSIHNKVIRAELHWCHLKIKGSYTSWFSVCTITYCVVYLGQAMCTETAACYKKFNLSTLTMSFPGFFFPCPLWTLYGVFSSLPVYITAFFQRQYIVIVCTYKLVIGAESGCTEIMLQSVIISRCYSQNYLDIL